MHRLPSGTVRVFVSPMAAYDAVSLRQLERAVLVPEEQRRSRAILRASSRDAFVAAHALKRLVLGALLGRVPHFSRQAGGKPVVDGNVLHFNISHCDSHVALALCGSAPVGVDVESVPMRVSMPQVMHSALTATERARVMAESDHERSFLIHWTAKEAYVKATGEGLSRGFDTLTLGAGAGPLHLLGDQVAAHRLHCRSDRGHVLSVCTLGDTDDAAQPVRIEAVVCSLRGVETLRAP
ncbi:4'-phosphopantetheinyl transferase family protein [Methyloversatilis discipulorum]|uniref:4'-phosphopantetheinyl transferase family protein n=1 Tax=Methyloversatilis discipulorum TaxID=1119528 RepID=UPI0026EA4977|nr:4'-phosphopantetheinyl transferase superfamily protein [Methyloversatilis discipulorum]